MKDQLKKENERLLFENKTLKNTIDTYNTEIGNYLLWISSLYDAHSKLTSLNSEVIYTNMVEIFETILKGSKITIHRKNNNYLHLISKTKAYVNLRINALPYESFDYVFEHINEDRIFINYDQNKEFPSLIVELKVKEYTLYVSIHQYNVESLTGFVYELLKSTITIVSRFLTMAYDHEEQMKKQRFIEGTKILNNEFYSQVFQALKVRNQSQDLQYMIVRLHQSTKLIEISDKLSTILRDSDIIGSDGEHIYVILINARTEDFDVIVSKFSEQGLSFDLITDESEVTI